MGGKYDMCGNILTFMKMKPPITIMILFVAMLSCSFFVLAMYVQSNEVLDQEASKAYQSLLEKMSLVTFCLSNHTEKLESNDNDEFIDITLPLMPTLTRLGNSSYNQIVSEIIGIFPSHLIFEKDHHLHHVITRTFMKPPLPDQLDASQQIPSCVMVTLKKEVIPNDWMVATCKPDQFKSNHSKVISMSFLSGKKNERSLCLGGLQMTFDPIHKYDSNVYLNEFEKSKVKFRLHIASYVFFVMLLSVMIYAMLKGRTMKGSTPTKILQS